MSDNFDKKAAIVERHLLETQFPLECEDLPFDDLQTDEQIVVLKCKNHDNLTDEEFALLKKTLQKYRKYLEKHRPTETVEAMKRTVEIIETEQDLLDILDDSKFNTLLVDLPLNGKKYRFNFEILPIDDSRVVDYLQMNIDLFKDYDNEDKELFIKAQQGGEITPEEQAIVNKMTIELNAIAGEEKSKMIDGFLAAQLKLPNSSQDFETRERFWKRFPFLAKYAIVTEVEERLGLTELANEKLFPSE
jgi:hypothetical protein